MYKVLETRAGKGQTPRRNFQDYLYQQQQSEHKIYSYRYIEPETYVRISVPIPSSSSRYSKWMRHCIRHWTFGETNKQLSNTKKLDGYAVLLKSLPNATGDDKFWVYGHSPTYDGRVQFCI